VVVNFVDIGEIVVIDHHHFKHSFSIKNRASIPTCTYYCHSLLNLVKMTYRIKYKTDLYLVITGKKYTV
jgi:hypothetical protein